MKKYKNKLILICALLLFILLTIGFDYLIKRSQNDKISKKSLEEIGKKFYTEYLYKNRYDLLQLSVDENKKIKIDIVDILYMIEGIDIKTINESELFSKCDVTNSQIVYTIYEPISKTNYDIELELDCR